MFEAKKTHDGKNYGLLEEFRKSFKFDRRLFFAAIRVNLAYCNALFHAGVLTRVESERIKNGLQTLVKRADFNKNFFDELVVRDVHSFIEIRLVQLIGDLGEKLSVGRNQNDQNATAFRLWLRVEIEEISKNIRSVQQNLVVAGENQKQAVLPAYSHQKKSQIILWAHWCLAYFEMLARDRERLEEVWRRVNVLPLGAANAAGTSIEIDREEIARELNFEGISANSLDTANDADFAIEMVGACSLTMMHLSRLAEDLILYGSDEFNFIELTDIFSTDTYSPSKNLDVLEIIRAKASRIFGHQTTLLSTLKSLPLGVFQDLQETSEIIFDTVDTIKKCLEIAQIVLENIQVNELSTGKAAMVDYLNADELFDYLIQRETPLKIARSVTRRIVGFAISKRKKLEGLTLDEMRRFSENINADVFGALSLEQSLASKNQIGGTAPERVFEALEIATDSLQREES